MSLAGEAGPGDDRLHLKQARYGWQTKADPAPGGRSNGKRATVAKVRWRGWGP